MSRHLETIVKLQAAISDLDQADRQLAGVPDWMEELHAEHVARRLEIEAVEEAAEEAARQRRRAEVASQDAEEKLKHFQQQVSLVRTQREYSALLQEIDTVKRQIKELEELALGELERYDEAQQALEEQRGAFQDLDARYREALAQWEGEKPEVEGRAHALRTHIEEMRATVPRPLLSLFDRLIEHRNGDAIAAIRKAEEAGLWHCTSCNYRVRLQVVSDIQLRGSMVQCDGCKRILYVEDEG